MERMPVGLIHRFIERRSHRHPVYTDLWWEWQGALSDLHALRKHAIPSRTVEKITRRGMPLAYAIGRVDFMGLDLAIKPPLLIPRPDTASWLDKLLPIVRQAGVKNAVDFGCGAGTIALSIANKLDIDVTGVDCNPLAIRIARHNSLRNNITNCTFIQADMKAFSGSYDLIISNPPYIPRSKRVPDVSPSTRRWESHAALHPPVHDDGTYYHREIIRAVSEGGLRGCKVIAMELDGTWRQFETVKSVLEANGFRDIQAISDSRRSHRAILAFTK